MNHIIVLALTNRDGYDMKRAIEEYATDQEQEAPGVTVCTDPGQLDGIKATELVMTEEFSSQRSIRMLYAAQKGVMRGTKA